MGKITLQQAAKWCGGKIDPKFADVAFFGANNDTRKLQAGELFIALKGARDGHDFMDAAFEKGAAAVLCNHCEADYPAIIVPDVRVALGDIAREERQRLGMKVVGVTGSVGKSTTKEMTACVLKSTYRTSKTPVNHNNDIGMPMAILAIPEDTEVAVLEMGMNHFGEISYLTNIAKPDVAVIINVGTMHIEHLGSREGILQAKLEILEGLSHDGKILLNGDNDMLWRVHDRADIPAVYFGADNKNCAILAKNVAETASGITFTVEDRCKTFDIHLGLEGTHFVSDALAAVGVGLALGVTPENISRALATFENMEGRQQIFEKNGFTIIQDCYNAGPESMKAALEVLGKRTGRRIAVLGDMLELGSCAAAEHYKVGQITAENADMVFAYGPNGANVVDGAVDGGMIKENAKSFESRDALADALRLRARSGDVVLFKGSHGMHMELALERFLTKD